MAVERRPYRGEVGRVVGGRLGETPRPTARIALPSPRRQMRTAGTSFGNPLSSGLGGIFRQRYGKLAAFGRKSILLKTTIRLVRNGPFQYAVLHQNS